MDLRQSTRTRWILLGFFKAAWPVVGGEVSNAIIDFFKTGRLLKQLNATMLTLIPKVRTPNSVADLRPISCCNVIYKVITKILVSRIREILELLISPSQNAFVPGRLFSDNVLLAQELFSGYNQCRLPPRCALKVDLRKAYDTVEWDFLFATLRMFGFPAIFIRWIEECVTSAHYSVIVNGCMDSLQGHEQLIEQDGEFQYHWRCQELNLMTFFCCARLMCVRLIFLDRDLIDSPHSRKDNFRSDTLVSHLFQHGFLSQIVNHCFRRLTGASKDGRSPAFLCWPGPTYQICFDLLRSVLGYGIYFVERNYQRDDEAITYFPLER
ncbi:hypothetical protein Sango_3070900 [Sesamum angolense]|uniref:Reverse transcriptase domain-containing protein n=1 Tax=Sesamum angolense TaxID=2727404 RepID=A0AAE1VZD6_9LAMI|nr:hypothetical protein Sango_3070900 [Sesamum angolense]